VSVAENDVRTYLFEQLEPRLRDVGLQPGSLTDETDLFEAGVIDSLGIVELVALVSDRYGIDDEWEDYDPDDLLVIGPFCRYVALRAATDEPQAGSSAYSWVVVVVTLLVDRL
jgi:acyl carrier protein